MLQADRAGWGMGGGSGWMMRRRTETTGCNVGGDENGNFAGFELGHDAEGGGEGWGEGALKKG